MTADIIRLKQVLELEKNRGFDNDAVFGGLDRFLSNWLGANLVKIESPSALSRLRLLWPHSFSYGQLSPDERAKWSSDVLSFLSGQARSKLPDAEEPRSQYENTTVAVPISGQRKRPSERLHQKIAAAVGLESPITVIKGISIALSTRFSRVGIKTIRDMLYFFPSRHIDYSHITNVSWLAEAQEQTVSVNVWEVRVILLGGRRSTEAIVGDDTGNVRALWFNNPWVAKSLRTGDRIILSGRVKVFHGRPVFESPEWELFEDREDLIHTGRLVPVYPLTSGLHQRQVRKLVKQAVKEFSPLLPDFLPGNIRRSYGFPELQYAIAGYHYPDNMEVKEVAGSRLAFDELFLLQLGVLSRKRGWQSAQPGVPMRVDGTLLSGMVAALPFKLTNAQGRVLTEIIADMGQSVPMARLLQGEVGSGKTAIAVLALLTAVASGFQGALMAPTEVLAGQHFKSVRILLAGMGREIFSGDNVSTFEGILDRPLTVALLMSDLKAAARSSVREMAAGGSVDIVLGTHALIQKGVKFKRLGLAIVDEQHRFGVSQRTNLRQKGFNPHLLAMTATPIPRTLALTIYGDLDLSVLDELPPGRQTIKTRWLKPEQRASAYAFVRKQVAEKHQAFIICPLIEESETIQARSAIAEFERLSGDVFPDLRLALLHGRMSAREKDAVMTGFGAGETDILVSTPVVEVGVDVPNATVMMVESADRFGLAQLHQFRGRVGRGIAQSYCMLLADQPSDIALMRLDIIERVHDGFKLADEDLRLRGPGEFFGLRQSGIPDLRMAKLTDLATVENARKEATKLFEIDPELKQISHRALVEEISRRWPEQNNDMN
jgi:ATP-dependent DNA helicase RecG